MFLLSVRKVNRRLGNRMFWFSFLEALLCFVWYFRERSLNTHHISRLRVGNLKSLIPWHIFIVCRLYSDQAVGWTTQESWFDFWQRKILLITLERRDWPWGPPSRLTNGRNYPAGQATGAWSCHMYRMPTLNMSGAIPSLPCVLWPVWW